MLLTVTHISCCLDNDLSNILTALLCAHHILLPTPPELPALQQSLQENEKLYRHNFEVFDWLEANKLINKI